MMTTLEEQAGRVLIKVPGDILSTNVAALKSELLEALESPRIKNAHWSVLHLDLSQAKLIDSAGLNLIVTLIRLVKARGGKISAVVPDLNVRRIFLFTRLDQQLELANAA